MRLQYNFFVGEVKMLNKKKAKYIYPLHCCFIKHIIFNLKMLKELFDVIVYQQQLILSGIMY